uniref:Uncharacterized protein n=1 Tax=Anguilla anguilla TaxID=7936 RepID=A0A0E9XRT6_ANGAN
MIKLPKTMNAKKKKL